MKSIIAAVLALSSLVGCSNAGEITEPAPTVDVQTSLCNHPVYLGEGDSVWYAWVEYTTLPLVVEVKATGDEHIPNAVDDRVLEHWIRDMGDTKRVIVQCATETGPEEGYIYTGFQTVTFSAATSR